MTDIILWVIGIVLVSCFDYWVAHNLNIDSKKLLALLPAIDSKEWTYVKTNWTKEADWEEKHFLHPGGRKVYFDGKITIAGAELATNKQILKQISYEYSRNKLMAIHEEDCKRICQ